MIPWEPDDPLAVPEHEEANRERRRGEVGSLDRVPLDAPRRLEPGLPLDASRQRGHLHRGTEHRASLGERSSQARRLVLPLEELFRGPLESA